MKANLLLLLTFIFFSTYGEGSELCQDSDSLTALSQVVDSPRFQMTMDYRLSKDCHYRVNSEVVFPSSLSIGQILEKLVDKPTNLLVANPERVENYEYVNGTQITKAKKSGLRANIVTNCSTTASRLICKTDSKKTKAMGQELFEYNDYSVTCSEQAPTIRKCKFATSGKAKGMLIKGSCDLAAGGAVETFEATYRMVNYLSTGTNNLNEKAKLKLNEFYMKASTHEQKGKGDVVINMKID
jgi:hypothetical protein